MKRLFMRFVTLAMLVGFLAAGCAPKAADSQQAIAQSKTMKTADDQAKHLVGQANAFINSKNFDEAIKTAQYILSNLDQNSADAKSILEKAQAELQKSAQAAEGDMKNKLGIK